MQSNLNRNTLSKATPTGGVRKDLLSNDFVVIASPVMAEDKKEKDRESDGVPAISLAKSQLQSLISLAGKGSLLAKQLKNLKLTCYVSYGTNISVNSGAAKYLQFIGGGTGFFVNQVASSTEWASLGSIFDEVFVHSMELSYMPVNKYSANTTANQGTSAAAGQPGFVNTLGANIFGLQHNQPLYADSSSTWYVSSIATDSKWVNLGDPFHFKWNNYENFAWDGPEGDTTTAAMTQSWLNIANVAKLGGYISIATPEASGAAAGLGALVEGGVFGHCLIRWKVSFRARS